MKSKKEPQAWDWQEVYELQVWAEFKQEEFPLCLLSIKEAIPFQVEQILHFPIFSWKSPSKPNDFF